MQATLQYEAVCKPQYTYGGNRCLLQDCGTAGHNHAECGTIGKHGLPKNQTNVIVLVLRVAIHCNVPFNNQRHDN